MTITPHPVIIHQFGFYVLKYTVEDNQGNKVIFTDKFTNTLEATRRYNYLKVNNKI